jgi:hypothetical protein
MPAPTTDLQRRLADAVSRYEAQGDVVALHRRLAELTEGATADALVQAAEPYRHLPEVAGPLYERVVAQQPTNARALVILGNAYWLHGRGPDVVGELASRAIAADPEHRGAWHLWALCESDPRARMLRWQQVTKRFPADDLAKALLADGAASVASQEHDDEAMVLAVATYEDLLTRAERPEQKAALEQALTTLRGWKL